MSCVTSTKNRVYRELFSVLNYLPFRSHSAVAVAVSEAWMKVVVS